MAPVTTPLLQNILAQPGAMRRVLAYQVGAGLPALKRAADLIREQRRVIFSAIGGSYCASLPAARRLAAPLVDASELLHYFEHTGGDAAAVFVLVSRSGETVEIVRLLPRLKERGAMIIGVTNEPGSPLDRQADVSIRVNSPPDQMAAVQTYTGTLVTLHLLGEAVRGGPDAASREEVEAVIAAAERALPAWEEASRGWRTFFEGFPPVYLLARGTALASALAGALLLHEVAKTPAIAMGAGHFRHGPAEVAGEGFRALVFAPPDATQALNRALALDLARLGGQVRVIGPPEGISDAPGLACWPIEPVSPWLSPILEILPVQFAAYRLAEWKGVTPGEFRVVGQVTRSETGFG